MIAIKLQDPEPTMTQQQTTLYAHADVLTKSSLQLQDLLKSPEQQQQHSITLQEVDAKSLNIYINWLYTRNIHAGHRKDEAPTKTSP